MPTEYIKIETTPWWIVSMLLSKLCVTLQQQRT